MGAMAHLCWLLSIITIFNQKALISSIVPHSKSKAYQLSKTFVVTCADSEGGGRQGVWTPMKNYNNIGFLSNTGPDPLKITKLPSQHSMLSHHRYTSETPFKWRFAGVLMMEWHLDPPYPHKLKKKKKRRQTG